MRNILNQQLNPGCPSDRALRLRPIPLLLIAGTFVSAALSQPIDLEYYRSDLNYDGVVDQLDEDILKAHLNMTPAECTGYQFYHQGDIDRDGLVTSADQAILWADWISLNYAPLAPIPDMPGILVGSGYDNTTQRIDALDWTGSPTLGVPIIHSDIDQPNHKLWQNLTDSNGVGSIAPSKVEFKGYYEGGRTDGFDVKITWVNNDPLQESKNYGRIRIPGFRFGPDLYVRKFTRSSEEHLVENSVGTLWAAETIGSYPRGSYAPCLTMRGFVRDDTSPPPAWPDMQQYPAPIGQVEEAIPDLCTSGAGGSGSPGGSFQTTEPAGFREYVVGASVIMPTLEYKARTKLSVQRYWHQTDTTQRYWNINIEPNTLECPREYGETTNCNQNQDGEFPADGLIPYGETRTITIQIRFYRPYTWYTDKLAQTPAHPGDYLRLFREYRRYFKQTYGDVQYARDPRPVKRLAVGGIGSCSANAYGFQTTNDWDDLLDPDPLALGWGKYTATGGIISDSRDDGFQRQLLSGPSGAICGSPFNWPFFVSTIWDQIAQETTPGSGSWQSHPILTTVNELGNWIDSASISEETNYGEREISLWWGRSALPTFDIEAEGFDQTLLDVCTGSAGRIVAENELLGMAASGVTMIGLDASSILPEWYQYIWLKEMHELSDDPNTISDVKKFVTEAYSSDFVHTIDPTYFQMYKLDVEPPNGPHGMRDFLNQYAESWGGITASHPDINTADDMKCAMELLAQWGYSPVANQWVSGDLNIHKPFDPMDPYFPMVDPKFIAADSWLSTVPADLIEPTP